LKYILIVLSLTFLFILTSEVYAVEQKESSISRLSNLVSHLKKFNEPYQWLLVRKLYSSNNNIQEVFFSSCLGKRSNFLPKVPYGLFKKFLFDIYFVSLNMDLDTNLETLVIIKSYPIKVKNKFLKKINYMTFCLLDDKKNQRRPLSSHFAESINSVSSYQITDLTGDGKSEIIVHTNEMDRSGKEYSFVRILKLNKEKLLRGIWSSKLKEEKVIIKSKFKKSIKTFRKIRFIKVLQFNFQASKDPTEIIMKGKKEIEETTIGLKNGRSVTTTTFKKIPFESKWYWNKKEFRYFLLNR
tara:strand:- start:15 stop:908 length:894 start_codon:yes stop_codon:yes gene_type:complete